MERKVFQLGDIVQMKKITLAAATKWKSFAWGWTFGSSASDASTAF